MKSMAGREWIGEEEKREVMKVFDNGGVLYRYGFDIERNGWFATERFEKEFADKFGSPYCLATTSGTAALRIALACLGITKGDEVITQSFTFVATAEAIIESGAQPVFTQIDKTLNMDPVDLERKITNDTKAVIVVHMLGTPARLNEISKICKERGLYLIEDTAWGCGGFYGKDRLGTIGDIGTFSFDYAKMLTTGEGGMLTFRNEGLYKKAKAWHDHGHDNNPQYPRWMDTRESSGFNYRMMELQAAVGTAQLCKLDKMIRRQQLNSEKIWEAVKEIGWIEKRRCPQEGIETCDALIMMTSSKDQALRIREKLVENGIGTKILPEAISWHFAGEWEHIRDINKSSGKRIHEDNLDASAEVLKRCVAIPINLEMDEDTGLRVADALIKGR